MATAKESSGALIVLGIGLVQVAAGVFAPERIPEMIASGSILMLVGAVLFTWKNLWVRRGAVGALGIACAVFFVMMLRAPRDVPRTLVLGLAAALIVTLMNRPKEDERE